MVRVSPARAGVHHCRRKRTARCPSRPRRSGGLPLDLHQPSTTSGSTPQARGSPFPPSQGGDLGPSTPQARGSPQLVHRGVADLSVNPAGAGVYRIGKAGQSRGLRQPRGSGDTPVLTIHQGNANISAPRPRGYTSLEILDIVRQVSPAPAGIYPPLAGHTADSGKPRACGDTPSRPGKARKPKWSAPRRRGYTLTHGSP